MEKGKIIRGAFILTGANIITRLLGFFYRVYMADLICAEGMGLYQLIVPVYMLAWSISSSGFSTVISKLTASEKAAGRTPCLILKLSVFMSVGLGIALGFILWENADFMAEYILNDIRTALSLKLICFCFPFVALGSCIRGYFFGLQNSLPPAVSQVIEQITRMTVIFLIGGLLIPKGIEYACAAAVTGMCAGEIVSAVYILISLFSEPKNKKHFKNRNLLSAYKLILAMVIPLTLNRLISSLLSALENILIPLRLELYGLSKTDAISEFGRLSGMALPLIMFPSSFFDCGFHNNSSGYIRKLCSKKQ
ncbi:MAG: oligosaccharide flippase family protein [Clostridiales bacterium]|nr:oligosaccharide flippase family protein [Clostridiales bacterium]